MNSVPFFLLKTHVLLAFLLKVAYYRVECRLLSELNLKDYFVLKVTRYVLVDCDDVVAMTFFVIISLLV